MRVLLVEDEQYLAEAIQHLLKRSGYEVDIANDGEMGTEFAKSGVYGAIILDNMLPKKSGVDVLRTIRKMKDSTPVLMLSAKSETYDKVESLELGADDYLAKPFKTIELVARLKAITRRHNHDKSSDELSFGDITLRRTSHSLHRKDASKHLTAKEYAILDMLCNYPGKLVQSETLFHRAWGSDSPFEARYVSVYISYLRSKLKDLGSTTSITSTRGFGYRLVIGSDDV